MPYLLNLENNETYPLSDIEKTTIGRENNNDIAITNPQVSRSHCSIFFDERWILEDLNSKNGTYLNDEKIESPVQLGDQDVIQLVRFRLKFCLENQEDTRQHEETLELGEIEQ